MPASTVSLRPVSPAPRRALLALAPALVVLGVGVATYAGVQSARTALDTVLHTRVVLETMQAAFSDLQDAETGQRGYLLTGDSAYLTPYTRGRDDVGRQLATIRGLTADNVAQQRRLDTLDQVVGAKLAELARTVEARGAGRPEAAIAVVRTNEGKRLMDSARAVLGEMRAEELRLLAARQASHDRRSRVVLGVVAGGALLAASLALVTIGVFATDAAQRARQAERLAEQNDELSAQAEQLQEQATELELQAQQLEEQAVALEHANDDLRTSNDELRLSMERQATAEAAERRLERERAAEEMRRVRVEEQRRQLARQAAELVRSNSELQAFAYVASHDLQEPLRKIRAFGDRLAGRYGEALTEQGRDYLGRMQNAAERMQTLINDLLTYSRVATQARPFALVALDDVVRGVLADLEVRIAETGARVEVGELPTIEGDALQLRQLFQNLIGNALKFRRRDVPSVVRVSARTDDENVIIEVADNGIGFDEKYLERVFGIFQRLHGREEYEGTGVGLAIVRRIAERHGGAVTARSAEGQGATFVVTLPLRHAVESIESIEPAVDAA